MTRPLISLLLVAFLAPACYGESGSGVTVAITKFEARPASVAAGKSAILSWTVVESESVSISGGGDTHSGLDAAGTLSVLLSETTTFTLTATGGGSEVTAQTRVEVDTSVEGVPPEIHSFKANPDTLDPGEPTVLSWRVTGATELTISGGEAPVHLEGEQEGEKELTPVQTTTYTLEAKGPGGTTTAETEVVVRSPAIASFTALPAAAGLGQPIRLEWTTDNADTITIEPAIDVGRELSPDDSVDVFPEEGETTYVLTASNSAGGVEATAQVEVSVRRPPQIVEFSITPDRARVGEAVYLLWSTIGVRNVVIEGLPEESPVAPDRVQELDGYPIIAVDSTTFRLIATGPGGGVEAEATLEVFRPPTIDRFEADPSAIALGDSTTLRWSTTNTTEVRISPPLDDGRGDVGADGSGQVTPERTTTYRLTAIGDGGEEEESIQVVVHPPPVIDLFEATPAEVPEGANVTLRWRTRDATSVSLDPDLSGNFPVDLLEGTFGVQPIEDTTFVLTATSAGGVVEARISVSVLPRPVVATFRVQPNDIIFGEEVTLSWTTENATSIQLGPGLDAVSPDTLNGQHTFRPDGTGSFVLSALGRGGQSEPSSVRVTVYPRPIIGQLQAVPEVVQLGGESTLRWDVQHVLRVWFDPGPDIEADAFSGEAVVRPLRTTQYVLHAQSGFGDNTRVVTRNVTVNVNQPPVLVRFSAEPPDVLVGGSTILMWELTDADDITILDDRGAEVDLGDAANQAEGSVEIDDILFDRGFTLSAGGPGGALPREDEPTVEVTVTPARLVISEVFFDRPNGADRGWEWVELFNPTDVDVPLSPYSLGIGTVDWKASSTDLRGTIAAQGCIVVGGPNSGEDNHDPEIDVEVFPNGFNPTLRDDPREVVALGVHFIPQFFLPVGDPTLQPLDAVLYGWRNSQGFRDHNDADAPAPVTFQLYVLNEDGSRQLGDDGQPLRRIQSGWSIARTSPFSDNWQPQDAPTPGICFEDRPRPGPGWCQIQHPEDPLLLAPGARSPELYGRVYKAGTTEGGGQGRGIRAQVGWGPSGTDPDQNVFWTWIDADYNGDLNNGAGQLNDDEYVGAFPAPNRAGDFVWGYRFQSDDEPGEWLYCDLAPGNDGSNGDDAGNRFDSDTAGVLTVRVAPPD